MPNNEFDVILAEKEVIEATINEQLPGTDGNGIASIVSVPVAGGQNVTINYTYPGMDPVVLYLPNGEQGVAGKGIVGIEKVGTVGLIDTYRITYTDATSTDFTVVNSDNLVAGTDYLTPEAIAEAYQVKKAETELYVNQGEKDEWNGKADGNHTHADLHAPHSDDQDLSGLVPKTTTVNGKALSGNISLDYSDVGASASGHTHTDLHTHSNKTALDAVSGTNTGDEDATSIKTKLGITTLSGSNTGDETNQTIKDKLGTDLTGRIPYTGATTDTDLGSKNLTTTGNITGNLRGGAEQTVANKNKFCPLVSDIVGNIIAKRFTYCWDGSTYVADYSNGFGYFALLNNTGVRSNGFGYFALQNNTGASSNGFGYLALQNNTGFYSNGFGYFALLNNTGDYSSGFGYLALQNNTGFYSNGFGYSALQYNTGSYSHGFGHLALRYNQKSNTTAVGSYANSAFLDNVAGNKACAYADVNATTDRITLTSHGFGATNAYVNIKYASTTGTAIGGLTVGGIYQIKIIDANTIGFSEGSRGTNITSQGTGDHTFTPQYAYTNTTCLGANTSPTADNQVVLGDTLVKTFRLGGTFRTITNSTDVGVVGEMCYDASYVYLCIATNTWKRIALSTW